MEDIVNCLVTNEYVFEGIINKKIKHYPNDTTALFSKDMETFHYENAYINDGKIHVSIQFDKRVIDEDEDESTFIHGLINNHHSSHGGTTRKNKKTRRNRRKSSSRRRK